MILTCPSCGTQYVVKDGAIPAAGRQVRCKACQHSWREFPQETAEAPEPHPEAEAAQPPMEDVGAQAIDEPREHFSAYESPAIEEVAEAPVEEMAVAASEYPEDEPLAEAPSAPPIPPEPSIAEPSETPPPHRLEWVEEDDDFSPFARYEPENGTPRSRAVIIGLVVLLIAAIVAGLWFFAPPELRQRLGIAAADETPLQLMMTHSDRTQLASGNEFLNISGRIINPTDQQQKVPPIHAQLHDGSGKVVYKWTIPPPTKVIPPGGSASFNSAELNIPPAAQELTVTLGEPKSSL